MVLEELLVLFADEMRHLNLLLISILLIHGILCANAARREDVSVVEDALDFIGRCSSVPYFFVFPTPQLVKFFCPMKTLPVFIGIGAENPLQGTTCQASSPISRPISGT